MVAVLLEDPGGPVVTVAPAAVVTVEAQAHSATLRI